MREHGIRRRVARSRERCCRAAPEAERSGGDVLGRQALEARQHKLVTQMPPASLLLRPRAVNLGLFEAERATARLAAARKGEHARCDTAAEVGAILPPPLGLHLRETLPCLDAQARAQKLLCEREPPYPQLGGGDAAVALNLLLEGPIGHIASEAAADDDKWEARARKFVGERLDRAVLHSRDNGGLARQQAFLHQAQDRRRLARAGWTNNELDAVPQAAEGGELQRIQRKNAWCIPCARRLPTRQRVGGVRTEHVDERRVGRAQLARGDER